MRLFSLGLSLLLLAQIQIGCRSVSATDQPFSWTRIRVLGRPGAEVRVWAKDDGGSTQMVVVTVGNASGDVVVGDWRRPKDITMERLGGVGDLSLELTFDDGTTWRRDLAAHQRRLHAARFGDTWKSAAF